jgi:hypothetical protein
LNKEYIYLICIIYKIIKEYYMLSSYMVQPFEICNTYKRKQNSFNFIDLKARILIFATLKVYKYKYTTNIMILDDYNYLKLITRYMIYKMMQDKNMSFFINYFFRGTQFEYYHSSQQNKRDINIFYSYFFFFIQRLALR